MVTLLTEDDVRASVTYTGLYEVIEDSLRRWHTRGVGHRPRSRLSTGATGLHVLAGADAGAGYIGVKAYGAHGRGHDHVVLLYRDSDGGLDAVVSAGALGVLRTGVASAVATRHMHGDTRVLGIVGSGNLATSHALAIAANSPGIGEIRVHSRDQANRERCAAGIEDELTGGTCTVRAVSSVAEACEGADVVCTTTTAHRPVLDSADVGHAAHVNAAGSNGLARVELSAAVVARSRVVVDSREQAEHEAGDLLSLAESGRLDWRQLPELGEIVSGTRTPLPVGGSSSAGHPDLTLFESLGIGLFDVTAAAHALSVARTHGLGTETGLGGKGAP